MSTTVAVRISEDMARRIRALSAGRSVSEVLREMILVGVNRAEDQAAEEWREMREMIEAENARWRAITGCETADEWKARGAK